MKSIRLIGGAINNKSDQVTLCHIDAESKYADDMATLDVLESAVNVDIDNSLMFSRRKGRKLVVSANNPHSVFFFNLDLYFVEDSILTRLNKDETTSEVAVLTSNLPVSTTVINSVYILSNGVDIGWFDGNFIPFNDNLAGFDIATPAGQYVDTYRGTLISASGSTLYVSKPYDYAICDSRYCAIPMGGYISMLAAVDDGFYVSDDNGVAFVSGTSVDDFKFEQVDTEPSIAGCFCTFDEQTATGTKSVVVWANKTGFHRGTNGGAVENLSEKNVSLPDGVSGVMFRRLQEGSEHYIAKINKTKDGNITNKREVEVDSQDD